MKEGGLLRIEPNGKSIVLDSICSHECAPLEEGTLEGYNLTCPLHHAVFDIRNSTVSDATVWATELASYPVKIEETTGNILIDLQGQKK